LLIFFAIVLILCIFAGVNDDAGGFGPPFLPAKKDHMQKEALVKVVEEWMEGTSFFLVDVKINSDNDIQIDFDSSSDQVDIDDCVSLTQHIESRFDRTVEDYSLEVGSAGLGQPFKVIPQFVKQLGMEVEVLPSTGKKFTGILLTVDEAGFQVEVTRKVKSETTKKPVTVTEALAFKHNEVKRVSATVRF